MPWSVINNERNVDTPSYGEWGPAGKGPPLYLQQADSICH